MHDEHVCHAPPTVCMHSCCFLAAECICTHHWLLQKATMVRKLPCSSWTVSWMRAIIMITTQRAHSDTGTCWQCCKLTSRTPRTPASLTVSRAAAASTVSSASQPPCGAPTLIRMSVGKQWMHAALSVKPWGTPGPCLPC